MPIANNVKRFFLLILLFSSCTVDRLHELEKKINGLKSYNEVRLDTISFFEWDEVLIAGPYASLDNIKGYNFGTFPSNATDYDQYIFIGFISKKEGVKWASPYRNKYLDLLYDSDYGYKIFKREDTNFNLKKQGIDSKQ